MKNWYFLLFGILVVFVFIFVGCDDDGDDIILMVNFIEDIYNLIISDFSLIEVELVIFLVVIIDLEIEIEIIGVDVGVVFSIDFVILGIMVVIFV